MTCADLVYNGCMDGCAPTMCSTVAWVHEARPIYRSARSTAPRRVIRAGLCNNNFVMRSMKSGVLNWGRPLHSNTKQYVVAGLPTDHGLHLHYNRISGDMNCPFVNPQIDPAQ